MGTPRPFRRAALRLAILTTMLMLGACNPVDTWRDWTGASKNDPDPDTTPNTKNLAAGEASDYPNLATVPPPPNRALTQAEREKLMQSLIADRTNAKYSDERLRAGFPAVSAPVPPPPPPPVPVAADDTQVKPAAGATPSAPSAAAAVSPAPGETTPATASSSAPASATASDTANAAPGQGLRKSGEP